MPTQVDIANMALARLSVPSIATINDPSPAARAINRLYTPVLNELLSARWWRFARARLGLTLLPGATAPFPWLFVFAQPAQCLDVRYLTVSNPAQLDMANDDRLPHEEATDFSTGTAVRVIYSDANPANLVCTYAATDPNLWDSGFTSIMSMQLAAEIAIPITGKGELAQAWRTAAAQAIAAIEPDGESAGVSRQQRGSERTAVR